LKTFQILGDRLFVILEVVICFYRVDCIIFDVGEHKRFSELGCEVRPVGETKCAVSLYAYLSVYPVTSASRNHVGHYETNLGGVVFEGFWMGADIGSTGVVKVTTSESVTVKVW
jgi:hypothetical protein